MELSNRDFQMTKTKECFKNNKICFFFQNSTERAVDWIITEQAIVEIEFMYYKINALAAQKVLRYSVHQLNNFLLTSTTSLLVKKDNLLTFSRLTFDKIATVFTFIAIKVNNVIYSTQQFKSLLIFYYQNTIISLYNSFIANIKTKNLIKILSK